MSGSTIDSSKEDRSGSPDSSLIAKNETESIVQSPLVLAIDTSSRRGSLALMRGRHPLAMYGADSQDTHSNRLIGEIDMILSKTGVRLIDIDALAVVTGPGSFTGLRIGLSTIKGLARPVNKPVVGVTALEATAHSAGAGKNILSFVNALRQEVYAQLFCVSADGAVPISKAMVALPETVLEQFGDLPSLVLVGDGVVAYRDSIDSMASLKGYAVRESVVSGDWLDVAAKTCSWTIAPEMPFLAVDAARMAVNRVLRGEVCKAKDIEAFYVRQSDAELKLGGKSHQDY